jgi:predicted DNA-binding protein
LAASPTPHAPADPALLYVKIPRDVRERLKELSGGQYRTIPGIVRMLIDRYLAEQAQAQEAAGGER